MRLAVVFGTRPEVIKLAPVVREAERRGVTTIVISTSQHRELLDLSLKVFELKPDIDLDIMTPNQDLFDVTVKGLEGLKGALLRSKPDVVLAQGDTTTVFAAALSSFYLRIPFGHVEAGLRTYKLFEPFPEEVNRQMVARIASWHFAPTRLAKENLEREKVVGRIVVTGNTVVDALEMIKPLLSSLTPPPSLRDLSDRGYVLVEVHRRENFGRPMVEVLEAVKALSERLPVVFPAHLNPNVQKAIDEAGVRGSERITIIPPADYLTMLWLISKAKLIITDSGGIQEEAPSFYTPVLVTRNVTERPEGVSIGVIKVVGTEKSRIIEEALRIIEDRGIHERLKNYPNPYGDGKASHRIVEALLEDLG